MMYDVMMLVLGRNAVILDAYISMGVCPYYYLYSSSFPLNVKIENWEIGLVLDNIVVSSVLPVQCCHLFDNDDVLKQSQEGRSRSRQCTVMTITPPFLPGMETEA